MEHGSSFLDNYFQSWFIFNWKIFIIFSSYPNWNFGRCGSFSNKPFDCFYRVPVLCHLQLEMIRVDLGTKRGILSMNHRRSVDKPHQKERHHKACYNNKSHKRSNILIILHLSTISAVWCTARIRAPPIPVLATRTVSIRTN